MCCVVGLKSCGGFAGFGLLPSGLFGRRVFSGALLGSLGGLWRGDVVLLLVEGIQQEIAELPDLLGALLYVLLQHHLIAGHYLQLPGVLLDLLLHLLQGLHQLVLPPDQVVHQ